MGSPHPRSRRHETAATGLTDGTQPASGHGHRDSGNDGGTKPRPPANPAGQPYPFLAPPERPDEIGRLGVYRVLNELGRGGMGVVFCAEDTLLKRRVALKAMLPTATADPLATARFQREAQAQAKVDHDHVAVIHQVGEVNGVPFIAMPLLKGQTLGAALKANPHPPTAELVRIAREVAEGLTAAHAVGLVHRDIKPGNVWLEGSKRRVRILDFGLARELTGEQETQPDDGTEPVTARGAIVGTPAYMSPEQAQGKPVDARSDLFALGVVLYQMATGRLPFTGPTALAVLVAVAHDDQPAPHAVSPDVPAALSDLIQRLLAKDPAARTPSAAAVAEELETI